MKKMIAVGLVGLAAGLVVPGVVAQTPQAEAPKWEQFCELLKARSLTTVSQNAAAYGKKGYELVSGSIGPNGSYFVCYRRPAR